MNTFGDRFSTGGTTVSRFCLTCALVLAAGAVPVRADDNTPKAAATRKLLKKKITVDFKDTRLEDALDEIKDQVKGLKIIIDSKGGVSRNQTLNYEAKDKSVEEVFAGMFAKNGLGYIVISKKNNAYDGLVQIRQGKERGYEKGKEPK
jgi:type II secretory pathway component GspD/PulD (secretin)